jgi:hypothetical protein
LTAKGSFHGNTAKITEIYRLKFVCTQNIGCRLIFL